MNSPTKSLVEGYDVEYNRRSKSLKMTLLLDEESIRLVLQTGTTPLTTKEEVAGQVLELLERSIHLNLPRKVQQGPHGPVWNIPDVG